MVASSLLVVVVASSLEVVVWTPATSLEVVVWLSTTSLEVVLWTSTKSVVVELDDVADPCAHGTVNAVGLPRWNTVEVQSATVGVVNDGATPPSDVGEL